MLPFLSADELDAQLNVEHGLSFSACEVLMLDALKRGQNTVDAKTAVELGLIHRIVDLMIPEDVSVVTV